MTPRTTPAEVSVQLDRSAEAALPVQLAAALREAIDAGRLRPAESLPATRAFAARLGVARGVVVAAYEQLVAEGYLLAERGRGTSVNPQLGTHWAEGRGGDTETADGVGGSVRLDSAPRPPLAPGVPLTDAAGRPAWRAAWRNAARADEAAPALGDPQLRREIAEHLRLVRGTSRPASDVLVTAGAREGLALLFTALAATRERSLAVGVEDPGYPSLRGAAGRLGARIVSLPVDDQGLRTDALPDAGLDFVIVTPSHQYPVGGSLPLARRRQLLDWAHRTGVVVIEDDYDSELRHTGSPLPALAALDDAAAGTVVTLGTFSNTVSPALSAGFLLAPKHLRRKIEPVRQDLGSPVSAVTQRALASYLESGELRRNIARLRRRHAARRDIISEQLAVIPGVRLRPMVGGLHAVIELTRGGGSSSEVALDLERAVVARAAQPTPPFPTGLGIAALGDYWQHRREDRAAGFVFGMGGPDAAEFQAAVSALAEILTACLPNEKLAGRATLRHG